jgi:hypothetical protein
LVAETLTDLTDIEFAGTVSRLHKPEGEVMKVSVPARALVIGVATGSLLAVPLALPAAAVSQPASCAKITTTTVGSTIHITESKCLPLAATGGGGTGTTAKGTGKLSGSTINTITWASKHGTTKAAIKFAPATGNGKCATGTTRLKITGKVLSSTGPAAKVILANQPVTASVCVNAKTASTTLEPGTVEKL